MRLYVLFFRNRAAAAAAAACFSLSRRSFSKNCHSPIRLTTPKLNIGLSLELSGKKSSSKLLFVQQI
ncbi:unnamed protein product [Allacma fusca]|uniref:Uncharacterized protein n=1 Tax=Allacma fusca TaxID=39272 RepID=A0A8J2JWX7_9HEXA|nr:unnamed protein product [Allacma fusca]